MMFGVMLTNRLDGQRLVTRNGRVIPAVLIGVGLSVLFYQVIQLGFPLFEHNRPETSWSTTELIGVNLMTNQLLALELTAVLLLMALVGSAMIAGYHFKSKGKS